MNTTTHELVLNWEMFSHDLNSHRDLTTAAGRQEEKYVVSAIDKLSVLVDRTPADLEGQYYSVQTGRGGPAEKDLVDCYNKARAQYH